MGIQEEIRKRLEIERSMVEQLIGFLDQWLEFGCVEKGVNCETCMLGGKYYSNESHCEIMFEQYEEIKKKYNIKFEEENNE